MKANRLNLVSPVRQALIAGGFSVVKVVNAVNAALGDLHVELKAEKTGVGRLTNMGEKSKGEPTYKVGISQSGTAEGKMTLPLLFDAWHGKIEAAHKLCEFDSVTLPKRLSDWVGEFAKAEVTPVVPAPTTPKTPASKAAAPVAA